jgi:hypothetical protein
MIADRITGLEASRQIDFNDGHSIDIAVTEVLSESQKEWNKLLQVKIKGAMKLTGTQNNAGLHDLGVNIDLKLFDKQATAFAKSRVAKVSDDIAETTLKRVSVRVAEGIKNGNSIVETAKDIRDLFDEMSVSRSELIAQVETGIAASGGDYINAKATGLDLQKIWSNSQDEKVRESHQIREAVDMDDTFSNGLLYPLDPNGPIEEIANCFIGETEFESPDAAGLFRQLYVGQVVTIQTASGVKLTGTPNHPVLTLSGWKALGLLNEGDHVISGRFDQDRVSLRNPNADKAPSGFHDFYRSVSALHESHRIANQNVNFYGDRGAGDIDYIRLDRLLRNAGNAALTEPANHVQFSPTDLAIPCKGRTDEMLAVPANCSMGGIRPTAPLLSRRIRHSLKHAFASIAGRDARFVKSAADNVSGRIQGRGDRLDRFATLETRNDLGGIKFQSPARSFEIPLYEALRYKGNAAAEALCHLLKRESVLTGTDKIVSVERSDFSGHVFTLETRRGYYIANGVVVKNCRCTALYVPSDEVDQWL